MRRFKILSGRLKDSPVIKLINSFFEKSDKKLSGLKLPFPFLLKNSRILTGLLVFILIMIIFFFNPFFSSVSGIPVYKVEQGNFVVSVSESGEIRAKNSTSVVTPRVQGNLKIIYMVPEGNYVHDDDIVVKFDLTEALTNLKNAESKLIIAESDRAKLVADQRSKLTSLESGLKSAELSFELSKLNLEQMKFEADIKQRQANLEHEKNNLSLMKAQQDLESQKIVQKSELDKMDVEIQQAQADLKKAENDLNALTLKAPKEGLVVYEINWSTGRKVMIGDTPWPGMPIISLPDLSAMQSITYVNEVDVSRVKKDQKVLVKLDAFQDSTFMGVISSVASLGRNKDRTSNIKVFEVEVNIISQSSILKPGMTTSNKIILDEIANVVYAPQESVFDKGGEKIVYVKSSSGFSDQKVETGEKNEDYIVITKGLKQDDEVALIDPSIKIDETEINKKNNTVNFPSIIK